MKLFLILTVAALANCASVQNKKQYLDAEGRLILTSLLEENKIEEALAASEVTNEKFLGVKSYSGYFTVNKQYNSNLFFWFFPHESDHAPLLLYLQGGPGTSSLYSVFEENGPFQFKSADELELKENSWTQYHSVIYIDNPVGTGYSFTEDDAGYATNQTQVGEDVYEALRQFFVMFKDFRERRFYVTGECYAGHYVPAVCYTIDKKNEQAPEEEKINLYGFAIGSGWVDPANQIVYGDYLYNIGLLDSTARDEVNKKTEEVKDLIKQEKYEEAAYLQDQIMSFRLVPYKSLIENLTDIKNPYNYIIDSYGNGNYYTFLQLDEIREAIHVGNTEFQEFNNYVKLKLVGDIMRSMVPVVTELLNKGYNALFYTGQVDVLVPYPGVTNFISKMENWTDLNRYKTAKREIWHIENDLAGYFKNAGSVLEVVIRNAGHMAPKDQAFRTVNFLIKFTKVYC